MKALITLIICELIGYGLLVFSYFKKSKLTKNGVLTGKIITYEKSFFRVDPIIEFKDGEDTKYIKVFGMKNLKLYKVDKELNVYKKDKKYYSDYNLAVLRLYSYIIMATGVIVYLIEKTMI